MLDQEGQGRQSGMSTEGNGGVNSEPQTAANEGESSANRSDENQETQSTQDGSGQSKSELSNEIWAVSR